MRNLFYRALRRSLSFKRDKQGATAIEFALLALPFFMLLFAILELAIIFFISSTLNHAVTETGRQIRTGNFQNCGADRFKESVCRRMQGLGNCEARLTIDVSSETNFSSIDLPPIQAPDDPTEDDANPAVPEGTFIETTAGAPVVVRALYYHRLVLPTELTRLENLEGKNIHLISAITAFQNEPFPSQSSTCL